MWIIVGAERVTTIDCGQSRKFNSARSGDTWLIVTLVNPIIHSYRGLKAAKSSKISQGRKVVVDNLVGALYNLVARGPQSFAESYWAFFL